MHGKVIAYLICQFIVLIVSTIIIVYTFMPEKDISKLNFVQKKKPASNIFIKYLGLPTNLEVSDSEDRDEKILRKLQWEQSADYENDGKVWDIWGDWTSCSVSCGIGRITRWRHCVAGKCAPGEKEAQIRTCTQPAC